MALVEKTWNKFKAQPEIWFFYGFLLTNTLSIRKVFFDYPLMGAFNEYTGIYLYLSDLFFIGMMATWLISILYNKYLILSKRASSVQRLPREAKLFHMEQFSFLRGGTFYILLLPLILAAWSFLSIIWSDNASIAIYRSVKLFEFYLLYLFLALNCRCSTPAKALNFLRNIFRIIIAIGLINAMIGISQVLLQHSLGLFWLGESLISPDLPGVAKIALNGSNYIRAYGLFPHPNILGGFLFLSIMMTIAYNRLFYVEQSAPYCAIQCSEWKNGACKTYSTPKSFFTSRICSPRSKPDRASQYLFAIILGVQIVLGILTFSKSAILGLILALSFMFHMKHFKFSWSRVFKKLLPIATIISLVAYLINLDFYSIFVKSLAERLIYIYMSLGIISSNLLAGIGAGQFILEMQKYSPEALLTWQFQPVHNVFLLIWSELGLVGFGLFFWFIWRLFHPSTNVPRGTSFGAGTKHGMVKLESQIVPRGTEEFKISIQGVFKALLIGFFAIALFDHYLWDIQQGQIMFWLVLGFLARTNIYKT